jgi:hypothetical protein
MTDHRPRGRPVVTPSGRKNAARRGAVVTGSRETLAAERDALPAGPARGDPGHAHTVAAWLIGRSSGSWAIRSRVTRRDVSY